MAANYTEPAADYPTLRYIHATVLLLYCLFSLIGNSLNLLVLRRLTSVSESRKIIFIFLSNVNIGTGFALIPYIPAVILRSWPFGSVACLTSFLMFFLNLSLSICFIFYLTLDCFIAVMCPFRYTLWITKSRVFTACVVQTITCIIILSIAVAINATFTQNSFVRFYPLLGMCYLNFNSTHPFVIAMFPGAIVIIVLALLIIVLQGRIAGIARRQALKIAVQRRVRVPTNPEHHDGAVMERGLRQASELKGVYVCMVVSASFFISWLPASIWHIIITTQIKAPMDTPTLNPIMWLALFQCWGNIPIYMLMKKSYRDTLKAIISSASSKCCPQRST